MDVLLYLGPLTLACLTGAVLAGLRAASPDTTPSGRVGFGILAGVLGILTAALAFAAYFLWSFSTNFTF